MGAARRRKARHPDLYGAPKCPGSCIGKPERRVDLPRHSQRERPTLSARVQGLLAAVSAALIGNGGRPL